MLKAYYNRKATSTKLSEKSDLEKAFYQHKTLAWNIRGCQNPSQIDLYRAIGKQCGIMIIAQNGSYI